MRRLWILTLAPLALELQAAAKSCEELRAEIAAKLEARGVQEYQLEITRPGGATGWTVVGSCEGGSREILYRRGLPEPMPELDPDMAPPPEDEPQGMPAEPIRPLR